MNVAWTRESVIARVAAEFAAADRADVLAALDGYAGDTPEGRARVQLAVLHAAKGDMEKIRTYSAHANVDFRDVLWWAEGNR